MNPERDQAIPLHNEVPGQPERPALVQYTTVNITTEAPKDHIVWSLISCFHSNILCPGLAAIICSIKARDRKMAGDTEDARAHGATAFNLNVAATILFVIAIVAIITVVIKNPDARQWMEYLLVKYI